MNDLSHEQNALQCMEIIGGNRAVQRSIAAHGLEIWIDSRPLGTDSGGGDVHYVSTCGGGQVTRLVLADVAGHGETADKMAVFLRKLMRKYINTLNQTRFARALNQEFGSAAESGRFATAILLTYFSPTGHLIVCNAGHGRPLRYSAKSPELGVPGSRSACRDCPFSQEFQVVVSPRSDWPICRSEF